MAKKPDPPKPTTWNIWLPTPDPSAFAISAAPTPSTAATDWTTQFEE
jgi:hypothetical protein